MNFYSICNVVKCFCAECVRKRLWGAKRSLVYSRAGILKTNVTRGARWGGV